MHWLWFNWFPLASAVFWVLILEIFRDIEENREQLDGDENSMFNTTNCIWFRNKSDATLVSLWSVKLWSGGLQWWWECPSTRKPSLAPASHLSPLWCHLGFLSTHARKTLVHTKSLTQMQIQGQHMCCRSAYVCTYTHLNMEAKMNCGQPQTQKHTHRQTKTFANSLRNKQTHLLWKLHIQTHTSSRTHIVPDTLIVKPQCSEPEYSAADVRPALPRIPPPSSFSVNTGVSPFSSSCKLLAAGCYDNTGLSWQRLHNWGMTGSSPPLLVLWVWMQVGLENCFTVLGSWTTWG